MAIEFELASLRERALAFCIDFVIVISSYYLLVFIVLLFFKATLANSNILMFIIFGLLPIAGLMLYEFCFEIFANGQSPGKKAMGIKVIRLDGREPGLSEFLLRTVFQIIDIFLSFGIVAAMFISSSQKNQRLGDIAANTTIIRMRSNTRFNLEDILKISSLENYIPQFPQVKQLDEQHMLLIKEALKRHKTYDNKAHKEVLETITEKLVETLNIQEKPKDSVEFLNTLLRDYIVLTR